MLLLTDSKLSQIPIEVIFYCLKFFDMGLCQSDHR